MFHQGFGDHSHVLVWKMPKGRFSFRARTVLGTQMLSECPVVQRAQLVLGAVGSRTDHIGSHEGTWLPRTHSPSPSSLLSRPELILSVATWVFWPKLFPNPEHFLPSLSLYFKFSLQCLNLRSALLAPGALSDKPALHA